MRSDNAAMYSDLKISFFDRSNGHNDYKPTLELAVREGPARFHQFKTSPFTSRDTFESTLETTARFGLGAVHRIRKLGLDLSTDNERRYCRQILIAI
jgi:hypothetical protein